MVVVIDQVRDRFNKNAHVRMPHALSPAKFREETEMATVSIRSKKDGPYLVEGEVDLFDSEGNKVGIEKPIFALCRCGASSTKPFCDGTHSKIGFQAGEVANPLSAE
jgi:CDGSH-type Zn-finger protein